MAHADHEFCDECPLCRPALIDMRTGRSRGPDDKLMKAVNRIWDNHTSYEQRRAFIRVTRFNSQAPEDQHLFHEVAAKIQRVAELLEGDEPPQPAAQPGQFDVKFLDSGREPQEQPNPKYPSGVDIKAATPGPHCRCSLPYPAPRCGSYVITCTRCGSRAACTTAGRPDDPRSIEVPCRVEVQTIRPDEN